MRETPPFHLRCYNSVIILIGIKDDKHSPDVIKDNQVHRISFQRSIYYSLNMEQPAYAIDGTKEPNTRLNIDDFSTNDDYKIQWGLYLRALNVLQAAPPTDFKGYYRIAGIYQCFSGFIFTSLTVISNSWSADYDVARRHRSAGQDNLLLTWDVRSPPLFRMFGSV